MGLHSKYPDLQAGEESDGNVAGSSNRRERVDSSSSADEAGSPTSRQLPEASPIDVASSEGADTPDDELPGGEVDDEETPEATPVHPVDKEVPKRIVNTLSVQFKATLPANSDGLLDGQPQILKMPHFIQVESETYEAENFKNAMTPDDLKDEQARDDFVNRLKTTVRWRVGPNNDRESNARIVRWSDNSETFHVGSESFDVVHHPVTNEQSHLYLRSATFFLPQGPIKDRMSLRPKLDSDFGQSHVQGLRNRAVNKPKTGGVKVLMDMGADPVQDRERRVKEEMAQLRREERDKRRDHQMNRRKPNSTKGKSSVNPNTLQEQENGAGVDEFDEDDEPSCSTSKARKLPQSDSD
ncbi:hypothetical protein KR084_005675 [Drosophila pseudotakahashii]|nr:hypothetical protein KR084_005675 [Drosophila pseudotakahashii]